MKILRNERPPLVNKFGWSKFFTYKTPSFEGINLPLVHPWTKLWTDKNIFRYWREGPTKVDEGDNPWENKNTSQRVCWVACRVGNERVVFIRIYNGFGLVMQTFVYRGCGCEKSFARGDPTLWGRWWVYPQIIIRITPKECWAPSFPLINGWIHLERIPFLYQALSKLTLKYKITTKE